MKRENRKRWKFILNFSLRFGEGEIEYKKILDKEVALSLNNGDRLFFVHTHKILTTKFQMEVEYKYADLDKKEFIVVATEV